MTAVTADVVAVDLIASDGKYTPSLNNARKSFLGFTSDVEGGLKRIDSATGASLRNSASGTALLAAGFRSLLPYLSIGALVAFSKALLDIGDRLSDTAAQLGVTTQELQGLDYAARVSGSSSERLQQALSILTDQLGDARNGEGALAKMMRERNIEMGDTLDVLYDIADRTKAATTQQEKMAIATTALGRAGRTMVSFLDQGSDGLRRLQAEAAKKGQIWDPDTLAKLDAAKDSFETLEKAVVNIAAVPASAFISDLASLLEAIASGNWEAGIDKLARVMVTLSGAALGGLGGFLVGGPIGAAAGALGGGALGAWIESKLPGAGGAAAPKPAGRATRSRVPLSKQQLEKTAQEHADVLNLLSDRNTDALKASNESAEARRDAIRAEDDGLLQLRQGYADYYSWQRDVIEEMANLDIGSVRDRKDAELSALKTRQQADQARLTQLHASAAERAQLDQSYADSRVSIEQAADSQIVAINKKKDADLKKADEDWNQSHARAIQLSDGLRSALENVGLAGLKGFKSLKDAAASALEQVAQLIFQLLVMKPILDSLFGKSGTTGGGLLGGLFDATIPSFGSGTNASPGGLAWVGDKGRELLKLPKGTEVVPSYGVPQLGGSGGATYVANHFHLEGAVVTQDLVNQMNEIGDRAAQQGASGGAALARQQFPQNYLEAQRDTL